MQTRTISGIAFLACQFLFPGPAIAFDGEDPNDRIWQVHIFGEDDRGLSSYPFVGQIYSRRIRSEFSGFLCSARNIVTVAHGFTDSGNWKLTKSEEKPTSREFGDYSVRIGGCNRAYRINDVAPATTNSGLEYWKDYSVLTLEEDICPGVEIPRVGLTPGLLAHEVPDNGLRVDFGEDVALVAYYRPDSVRHPTSTAALPNPRYETKRLSPSLKDLGHSEQYAAVGRIFALSPHYGELFLWHYMDATLGGSGGALIVDADGSPLIVGMHTSGGDRGNHSIAAQGPFLDFMRAHCVGPGNPFD